MNLLKGLKTETKESLANLWIDKDFQKFVEVLRISRDNYGKRMLVGRITEKNWQDYRETQDLAYAFSLVIKTVEDAFREVNKLKKKTRSKNKLSRRKK